MIPFGFEYYQPKTIEEAVYIYQYIRKEGKKPLYYSGGTEIISMARLNQLNMDAVIDIKMIPTCNVLSLQGDDYIVGAAKTIVAIEEDDSFPLLADCAGELADHTTRTKITIGGNICGDIFYREGVLPFLLCDSEVVIGGINGIRTVPIERVFHKRLHLQEGELLIQIKTKKEYLSAPYLSIKKRKFELIDYPLVKVVAISVNGETRMAFTGVSDYPFRSKEIESIINSSTLSRKEKIVKAIQSMPPILDDILGSAEYRKFVLGLAIEEVLQKLEVK